MENRSATSIACKAGGESYLDSMRLSYDGLYALANQLERLVPDPALSEVASITAKELPADFSTIGETVTRLEFDQTQAALVSSRKGFDLNQA